MMGLLRLIASTKTTIFFFTLLALVTLFVAFGSSTALATTLMLDQGLSSIPALVILDLLLLNQLAAAIVRFRQFRARRSNPFYEHPAAEEEPDALGVEPEDEWGIAEPQQTKKQGKPLPFPAAMSERTGHINTLLPAENAEALLTTLSFRINRTGDTPQEEPSETIVGRYGSSSTWYTFALHTGAFALLLGLVMLLAFMPGQQTTIYPNQPKTLQASKQTKAQQWLAKIGLGGAKKGEAAAEQLTLSLTKLTPKQFSPVRYLAVSPKRLDTWTNSFTSLFIEPKPLALQKINLLRPTTYEVELSINGSTKRSHTLQLQMGESETHDGLQISLNRIVATATLKEGETTHKLEHSKKLVIDGNEFRVLGFGRTNQSDPKQSDPKASTCTLLSVSKQPTAKTPKSATKAAVQHQLLCVKTGASFKVGEKTLTLTTTELGIRLHTQRAESIAVLWLGLLLFVLGFIGFWWPTRYELKLLWRHGKNDITVRGTGLEIQPKELLDGIAKALYFPPEWLGGPAKSKAQPKAPSTPPVPTPPRQFAPEPPPTRAPNRPTQTQQRPSPQVPPAPNTAPQTVPQAAPQIAPAPHAPQAAARAPATIPSPPPKPAAQQVAAQPSAAQPNAAILPPAATPQRQTQTGQREAAPAPSAQTGARFVQQTPSTPTTPPASQPRTLDALSQQTENAPSTTTSPTAGRVAARPTSQLRQTDSFGQTEVSNALSSTDPGIPPQPQRIQPQRTPPPPPAKKAIGGTDISIAQARSKETGGQPTVATIQPESLLPTTAPTQPKKDKGFDLDSLFDNLESGKPTTANAAPADIALDLDALFNDFDDKMANPKKK